MPNIDTITSLERIKKSVKNSLFIGLVILPIGVGVDKFVDFSKFNNYVYGSATNSHEKRIKEMNFYTKTGIIFENMSAFDKSDYGNALQKGFIKDCD